MFEKISVTNRTKTDELLRGGRFCDPRKAVLMNLHSRRKTKGVFLKGEIEPATSPFKCLDS